LEIIDTIFAEGSMEKGQTYITATHVSQSGKRLGQEWNVSIPLHLLSSITFNYVAPVGWLVFGVAVAVIMVGLIVGAVMTAEWVQNGLWIGAACSGLLSLLCVALFFTGRKQYLVLSSASEKIVFVLKGTDKKLLRGFAAKVEEQQTKLVNEMTRE
jgi:hypothetical protein